MFKTVLKTIFRGLLKDRLYSAINIFGLAVGVACFTLIALWVVDEMSYDRFYPTPERIYRLAVDNELSGAIQQYAVSSAPMALTMAREIPEVEMGMNFVISGPTLRNVADNKTFGGDRFSFTQPAAVDMFGLRFIAGNAETAFEAPESIVLTQEMAEKYFGTTDIIGKTLQFTGRVMTRPDEREYRVTGVIENFPPNSHLTIDFLASAATLDIIVPEIVQNWDWYFSYSYVKLQQGADRKVVESKLPDMVNRYLPKESAAITRIWLQPVTDIHLHSVLLFDTRNGDIASVYLFAAIAILIILIACVNFMNLATARSLKRSKEVGVKKVFGADRKQLIWQFLGESVFTSFIAVLISIGLIQIFLPQFNELAQKELTVQYWGRYSILPFLLGLVVVLGLLAGSYPAFVLSAFKPIKVLRGASGRTTAGSAGDAVLRKTLIVLQFVISIGLIIGTQIVQNQLEFIRNKKLGFDKEHVVSLRTAASQRSDRYNSFRHALLSNPGILAFARSSSLPSGQTIRYSYRSDKMTPEKQNSTYTYSVDYDYFNLMGFEMVAGRSFSRAFATDSAAFVLNESAVTDLGWSNPEAALGQPLRREDGVNGTIIGVVKNFNFMTLRREIQPLVLSVDPSAYNFGLVRLAGGDIPATLDFIEQTYRGFFPEQPFELSFLEETIENQYRAELQLGEIFKYFAFLAIFIACLGLFGLSSFSAEQHTREIGLRKVLGASVPGVMLLLSKDFSRLVGIAFVIGCPPTYYLMQKWLADFAYCQPISITTFLYAGTLAFVIALISVSYNAVRAATANPIDSLRYE